MAHAVEYRQNDCLRPHSRREVLHRGYQCIRLYTHEEQIIRLADFAGSDQFWGYDSIAAGTSDPKTLSGEVAGSCASDQKGYIAPGRSKLRAKIAADRTGPNDQDSHRHPIGLTRRNPRFGQESTREQRNRPALPR